MAPVREQESNIDYLSASRVRAALVEVYEYNIYYYKEHTIAYLFCMNGLYKFISQLLRELSDRLKEYIGTNKQYYETTRNSETLL